MNGSARAISIALAVGVLGLFIGLSVHDGAMLGIQRTYAVVTNEVLHLVGQPTLVRENVVGTPQFGITVVTPCTGLFATGLFVAAVLLFPTTWRSKAIGCAIGVLGLALVNVLRLASLYLIGLYWPSALEAVHQLVWQSLLILVAVVLWLLWAGGIAGARRAER